MRIISFFCLTLLFFCAYSETIQLNCEDFQPVLSVEPVKSIYTDN